MPPSSNDFTSHIDALTKQMSIQNSYWQMLVRGIFYGVGFVIGSVVLATILIGIFLPFVKNIPGVQQAFQQGAGVEQQATGGTTASSTH